jgi:integrase
MARPKHKLSTKFIEKTNLEPGLYGDGGGLYLQVSNSRTKAWVFRYMLARRARKMGLGDVDRIGLAEARRKATEASSLIVDGKDPIDERKARKAALAVEQAKALSFKECAEQYIAMREPEWKHGAKSAKQWRSSLKAYVYPTIGNLPVAEIDKALILKILEPIWTTKTVTATRVRARIENILDWARAFDLRHGDNPAAWSGHLEHLLAAPSQVAPVENHAALPYAALPAFMAKLRAKEGVSARALEFTILCACRTGDTIAATRDEVDKAQRLWTVPGARLKGRKGKPRRDHVVPLSRRACEILKDLPSEGEFIFMGGKEGAGLSNAAMSELLKGMGYSGDKATVHGFRSTFMDWGHEMTAYPKEMMDIALAHTVADKVEAAYRRGDMKEKRRRLMEDWAAYCSGKTVGGANVVKIGRHK